MVLGGIQAFNLVSIVLLILPGLAGTKLYLREVDRQDRFGRLDTIVISIAGSLGGLFLIYLGYWVFLSFENCVSGGPFPVPAPVWGDLEQRVDALSEQIFHYALLIVVVACCGHSLGSEGVLIDQLPDAPNKAWRTLLEGVQDGEDDDIVRIRTERGERITGELHEWSVESQSIVVKGTEHPSPDVDNEELPGSRVYFDRSEIARVSVVNPQSGDGSGADGGSTEPNEDTEELVESAEANDDSDE